MFIFKSIDIDIEMVISIDVVMNSISFDNLLKDVSYGIDYYLILTSLLIIQCLCY